jgi:hypothetical protein
LYSGEVAFTVAALIGVQSLAGNTSGILHPAFTGRDEGIPRISSKRLRAGAFSSHRKWMKRAVRG